LTTSDAAAERQPAPDAAAETARYACKAALRRPPPTANRQARLRGPGGRQPAASATGRRYPGAF